MLPWDFSYFQLSKAVVALYPSCLWLRENEFKWWFRKCVEAVEQPSDLVKSCTSLWDQNLQLREEVKSQNLQELLERIHFFSCANWRQLQFQQQIRAHYYLVVNQRVKLCDSLRTMQRLTLKYKCYLYAYQHHIKGYVCTAERSWELFLYVPITRAEWGPTVWVLGSTPEGWEQYSA